MKDRIFTQDFGAKFSFNREVASVFDDMLPRSVPYYNDNIALIANLLEGKKAICDLGCSTGNLLLYLAQKLPQTALFGIDNSAPMLDIARAKASAYGTKVHFIEADILDFDFKVPQKFGDSNANRTKDSQDLRIDSRKKDKFDAIIANYTMQFIRPQKRESLCKKICDSLQKNGAFVMSEKLVCENAWLDKKLIDIYHAFKAQNGYSKTEISKKREALENILIPFSENENVAMLMGAGFGAVEVVFRFGNFATFIALKGD
ncbi:methyltransferase domain-containing protein [Helicobacter sp. 23-1045]